MNLCHFNNKKEGQVRQHTSTSVIFYYSCSLPTVTDIVDEELPSDEEPESEQGEPEIDVPKPPYFTPPDDGRCYLQCMPDETLLHIFTFLKTKDFLTTVSRYSSPNHSLHFD